MKKQKYDFGVLGGDARQIETAHHLQKAGYRVICYIPGGNFPIQAASLHELISCSEMLVAPLPFGAALHTEADENFYELLAREGKEGQLLFGGPLPPSVRDNLHAAKLQLYNVSADPVFTEENARLTAEGVVTEMLSQCLSSASNRALYKSRILLTGYGKCGHAIAETLSGFSAQLTVCDTDEAAFKKRNSVPLSILRPQELSTALAHFDFVINTAPCMIFDRAMLQHASGSTVFLDIVSAPGGIDMQAAVELRFTAKQLPGLPAKVSPQKSGLLYADAILKIIKSKNDALTDNATAAPVYPGSLSGKTIGIALTGSFCTYSKIWAELAKLKTTGAELLFILSHSAATIASRFGKPEEFLEKIQALTDKPPIFTIEDAEPIGPGSLLDALVIFPCTGNTAAKLSCGITDTPVLMAAKAHLRNEKPLILSLSTNDALGMNMKNIGLLLNTRHLYFVPFGQDDPVKKPNSMTAHTELLLPALEAALAGKQLQPVILSHEKSHQRSQLSVSVPKCDSNSALLSAAESTLTVHTAENSLSSPCTAVNGGDYTCAE